MGDLKDRLEKFIKEEQKGVEEYERFFTEMEEGEVDFPNDLVDMMNDVIVDEEEHIVVLGEIMEFLGGDKEII